MIEANTKNVEWLIERLYYANRNLQAEGITHPQFVLLTKGPDDRRKVECILWHHLAAKYGPLFPTKVQPGHSGPTSTRIQLSEIGASILLVDL